MAKKKTKNAKGIALPNYILNIRGRMPGAGGESWIVSSQDAEKGCGNAGCNHPVHQDQPRTLYINCGCAKLPLLSASPSAIKDILARYDRGRNKALLNGAIAVVRSICELLGFPAPVDHARPARKTKSTEKATA